MAALGRAPPPVVVVVLLFLLAGLETSLGAIPRFTSQHDVPRFPSSPEHNTEYFAYPGQFFELPPVYVIDPDANGTATGTIIDARLPPFPVWSFFSACTGANLTRPAPEKNPFRDFSKTNGCVNKAAYPWETETCPDGECGPKINYTMTSMPGSASYTNRSAMHVSFTLPNTGGFEAVPNPMIYLCLTAQDQEDSLGRNPTEEPYEKRCYKVIIQLPPRYLAECPTLPPPPLPGTPQKWSDWGWSADSQKCGLRALQPVTKVGVGQHLTAFVYFEDLNRDGTDSCTECDEVEMRVNADPGLPNDASLSASTGGPLFSKSPADRSNRETVFFGASVSQFGTSFVYLFSRRLDFKPSVVQAGLTYKMCITAVETHKGKKLFANLTCPMKTDSTPIDNCIENGRLSSKQCFTLQVVQPDVRMVESMDSTAGPFGDASAVSPETAVHVAVRVQCDYKWTLQLYEALDFDPNQDRNTNKADVARFERGIYSFTASAHSEYGLPKGAEISAPRKVSVCKDKTQDSCTPAEKATDGYFITEVDVTWRPPRGSESEVTTTCLRLHEQQLPSLRSIVRCARFEVLKCQVCVQNGDTLVSLARDYRTDWLQLWGANTHIANPNHLANPGEQEVITLGPTHAIDKAIKLSLLAKRFRTTPAKVLELNPDLAAHFDSHDDPHVLASDPMVPVETHVCLMPDICSQKDDLKL